MKRKGFNTVRLWQFYYQNNEGHNIATGIIRCKEPLRTKKYKRSLTRLNTGNCRLVGFKAIDEVSYFN